MPDAYMGLLLQGVPTYLRAHVPWLRRKVGGPVASPQTYALVDGPRYALYIPCGLPVCIVEMSAMRCLQIPICSCVTQPELNAHMGYQNEQNVVHSTQLNKPMYLLLRPI